MSAPRTEACRNCRFWLLDKTTHREGRPVDEGDIAFGYCRRRAPVVQGAMAALCIPQTAWGRDPDRDEELSSTQVSRASPQPATESADWCGEYERLAG